MLAVASAPFARSFTTPTRNVASSITQQEVPIRRQTIFEKPDQEENAMQTLQANYFTSYRSLNLTRDADGVLVVEFHSNGGPFIFTGQDHTVFVDAFYQIAQDRTNKIVILTGTGGEFILDIDFSSFGNVADPAIWSQVHDEGVQLL